MNSFFDQLHPDLREVVTEVNRRVGAAGGSLRVVGGAVRDALLGLPVSDLDLEVYGLELDRVRRALEPRFPSDPVGRSFQVLKLKRLPIDIAVPRREEKSGQGHRDFEVRGDPFLDFAEASLRRDFTINAIGFDLASGDYLDPHNGMEDLRRRILRPVSEKFAEDDLRALRGMQFIARFELEPSPEAIRASAAMTQEHLPPERLFEEWRKLLLKGVRIRSGLHFLQRIGWLRFYPELEALVGCQQDPDWHPEGDVWEHTLHALDAFAADRTGDPWEDLVVGFAVLCHDLGKPETTRFERGRIRSPGHEAAGVEPTRRFLARLTRETRLVEEVLPLVADHMKPRELHRNDAGEGAVRRLAGRVGRIDRLCRVARHDACGRPPLVVESFPECDWLLETARALEVEDRRPEPLVRGRDLLAIGFEPGPHLGKVLGELFELQLNGDIRTTAEGVERARKQLG